MGEQGGYLYALILGKVLGSHRQLVQIGIEHQVPAARPDVTDLHQGVLWKQMLNAEGPLIDAGNFGNQITTCDRNGELRKGCRCAKKAVPARVKLTGRAVGRPRVGSADDFRRELERRIAAHQRDVAEREVIVKDSAPTADGCGSLPERVPSEPEARLEEIVVFLENFRRQPPLQTEV